MTHSHPPNDLVCPDCHGALAESPTGLTCRGCRLTFPVDDGIADFARGSYYDAFSDPAELSIAQIEGLCHEVGGTIARIEDFYLPLIRSLTAGARERPVRVLDSGCGNGISVDLLEEAGLTAWGNDVSALRKWQWRERSSRHRLVVADSRKLPFPEGFFDVVLSSGVLEHIGVREEGGARYSVEPLPERDAERLEFLRELLRVIAPGGSLCLDFPNGAFPVDFWHGPKPGGARFHWLDEGFLPKVGEVRRYVRQLGGHSVSVLSPHRRLRMRQVGGHWYGKLFRWPMIALLRLMGFPGLRFLAGSALNPYLVLRVERCPSNHSESCCEQSP